MMAEYANQSPSAAPLSDSAGTCLAAKTLNPPALSSSHAPSCASATSLNFHALFEFCFRMETPNELQNQFVETVRNYLARYVIIPNAGALIAKLQEDMTPKLFVYFMRTSKPRTHGALEFRLEDFGISIPLFPLVHKKSSVITLAYILWNIEEYRQKCSVVEFILFNHIMPNPNKPISLTASNEPPIFSRYLTLQSLQELDHAMNELILKPIPDQPEAPNSGKIRTPATPASQSNRLTRNSIYF